MLWDPFLYCINDSIQGNSETGNKVFTLPSEVSINSDYSGNPYYWYDGEGNVMYFDGVEDFYIGPDNVFYIDEEGNLCEY